VVDILKAKIGIFHEPCNIFAHFFAFLLGSSHFFLTRFRVISIQMMSQLSEFQNVKRGNGLMARRRGVTPL
jgi:hypothetical protein